MACSFRYVLAVLCALAGIVLFVPDIAATTGNTARISVDSNGGEANGGSGWDLGPALTGDGRYVAFTSGATNLVPGIGTGVFVHDRATGVTSVVSVDDNGIEGNLLSHEPSISADGRFVAFTSAATNFALPDTNNTPDVFVRDRDFDEDGIFDEAGAVATARVSVDSSGNPANSASAHPAMSSDGRFVAFQSIASNLAPNDTNDQWDVFVHDLQTGTTERVSVDSQGNPADGLHPAISADGRYVAFYTGQIVPLGDRGVWVHDRQTITTTHISGSQNAGNYSPTISANGRYVAYSSLGDVWVHDRQMGTTAQANVDSAGNPGAASFDSAISGDGRFIAFWSDWPNFVPADSNSVDDMFVHDRVSGKTVRVSVDSNGKEANALSRQPALSFDGSVITFSSSASNLVADDTNGTDDVFVYDRGPSVGGIAELPEVAGTPLETGGSSGSSTGLLTSLAGAFAAGALALGAAGWYARRRWAK